MVLTTINMIAQQRLNSQPHFLGGITYIYVLPAIISKHSTMRKAVIVLFILFFSYPLLAQTKIESPKLKVLIDSLYQVDQQCQTNAIEAYQKGGIDSFKVYEIIEHQTFARHIPILKEIVLKHGYPTFEKVGKETSSYFFTLIQHSDIDVEFQSKMLALIKKQVANKQVKGSDYAMLYDRVQINNGKEQLYGTQVDYDAAGNVFPKNLKDKENVNKRRSEFGLSTLEEYLQIMAELHKKQNQHN
jgi:hypothetical protein